MTDDERAVSHRIIPAGTVARTAQLPMLYAAYLDFLGATEPYQPVEETLPLIARAGELVIETIRERILHETLA
jgi:hypothetical protein